MNLDNLDDCIAGMRKKTFEKSDQLTLGELILMLSSPSGTGSKVFLSIDGKRHTPTEIISWRGSYNELAIDYEHDSKKGMPIGKFRKMLKNALGATYEGYKGGEYTMYRSTPVWADHYGRGNNKGVVGVRWMKDAIIILTKECEF